MPRKSSAGRPALRAAPRRASVRNPQPVSHAPPAPVQGGGGSILGGFGSTIAEGMGFVTGSAVAHRVVDAIVGHHTIQHESLAFEAPAAAAAPMSNSVGSNACNEEVDAVKAMTLSSNLPTMSCAACNYFKRMCHSGCIFAPYFPVELSSKFECVVRYFEVDHVAEILNGLQPSQRMDAVKSFVYIAEARECDPLLGCIGYIAKLEQLIWKLEQELACPTGAPITDLYQQALTNLHPGLGLPAAWATSTTWTEEKSEACVASLSSLDTDSAGAATLAADKQQ